MSIDASYEACSAAAEHIRRALGEPCAPKFGIICGSGLGETISSRLQNPRVLPYSGIPGFPACTVTGHAGAFVFGSLGGKEVCVMNGRFHAYEGHSAGAVALPIRVMYLLGVRCIFVTNAAGGANPGMAPGDLVVIRDHVDFASLAGLNPLTGPNDERFGTRFPAMRGAYDEDLRRLAKECATEADWVLKEGVYLHINGPAYETPAATMGCYRAFGCDVIGMSTSQEVMVARHLGMRICAISMVTDSAHFPRPPSTDPGAKHLEVLRVANLGAPRLAHLLLTMIEKLQL